MFLNPEVTLASAPRRRRTFKISFEEKGANLTQIHDGDVSHRREPLEDWVGDEGVVVDAVLDPHPLPGVHPHADLGREDPRVLLQKVLG